MYMTLYMYIKFLVLLPTLCVTSNNVSTLVKFSFFFFSYMLINQTENLILDQESQGLFLELQIISKPDCVMQRHRNLL